MLQLTQSEVAKRLGINSWTVLNWEKGYTKPPIASIPGILRFVGYDPFPEPRTIPEHLLAKRRAMGWSIREAAKHLGVDEGTWNAWEAGNAVVHRKHRIAIARLLGVDEASFLR